MVLNDNYLKQIIPHCPKATRDKILPILNKVCIDYDITTELRVSAFLATLAVESGEFRYQEEIASGSAYEGRADLGNTVKGDGVRFKGHGRIQITGRFNHQKYTDYLRQHRHLPVVDFILEPKKLAQEPYATDSAGWFFAVHINANPLADQRKFLAIQVKVNGRNKKTGLPNHWEVRKAYYDKALQVLPDSLFLEVETKNVLPDIKPADFDITGNGTDIDTDELNGENTNDNNIFEQGELPNTSLEINKDGLKLQTNEPTDKPQEKIAVVKKKPFNFLENFWKKVTGFIMANIGLDGLTDRLQQVQALGFTAQFWKTIIYFTVAGGLIYLAYLLFKQWQANHSEKQQRTDLINANSTSTNKVDLIDEDKIADYEKRGYKIVTRG